MGIVSLNKRKLFEICLHLRPAQGIFFLHLYSRSEGLTLYSQITVAKTPTLVFANISFDFFRARTTYHVDDVIQKA